MTIFNETIAPGERKTIDVEIAKLHTMTKLKVPVIVERAKTPGPVVLFTAGLHGDELSGIEIVRQLIVQKINRPKCGTIICMPVVNVFGFVNQKREFPDGRDLNRVFPGSKTGSLASRFAYYLTNEIIPHVDYVIDFHSGGASRFNMPHIRIVENDAVLESLAEVFHPPLVLYSKNIAGSFRATCAKMNIKMLLFEGGKSMDMNEEVTQAGIDGAKRVLAYLGMLSAKQAVQPKEQDIMCVEKSNWIRAGYSGMFHGFVQAGQWVEKGQLLASISDPYGKVEHKIKAPSKGILINVCQAPIVYQGDALFHLGTPK